MTGRIRTVKPEFFRSPNTAKVSFPGRLFFEALWCWADDFGIGETNINGLLGFAFCDEDDFTAQDLRGFCAEVAQHFQVNFYEVRGRYFYAIPSWEEHQKTEKRAQRRKHPTPDDPDAVPDLRFQAGAESAPESPRKMSAESALEQGNRGTGEWEQGNTSRPPVSDVTHLPARRPGDRRTANLAALNGTAHSPQAHQIARAYTSWLETPVDGKTLSEIAVEIDNLIESDIDPHQIAEGIKAWHKSDSWSPTQIRRFVAKAARAPQTAGVGKPTTKALNTLSIAEQIISEMETA